MSKDFMQEKKAALDMLIEQGVDFNTAAELVEKKAEEIKKKKPGITPGIAERIVGAIAGGHVGERAAIGLKGGGTFGKLVGGVAGSMAGITAAQALHNKYQKLDSEAHRLQKKAAVDMLIENGIDFDTAVTLVAAKSAELDK